MFQHVTSRYTCSNNLRNKKTSLMINNILKFHGHHIEKIEFFFIYFFLFSVDRHKENSVDIEKITQLADNYDSPILRVNVEVSSLIHKRGNFHKRD